MEGNPGDDHLLSLIEFNMNENDPNYNPNGASSSSSYETETSEFSSEEN